MSSHMEIEERTSDSLLYDENIYAFLAVEGRKAFCNLTPPQLYPPGVELFKQGSPQQDVYCIESGLVKLVNLTQQGQELIVGLRSPGWILGSVPVIAHKLNIVTAITLTQCNLRRISADELIRFAKTDSQFSWHLHQLHCQEIYNQIAQLVRLRSFSARQRLNELFMQLISALESKESKTGVRLQLPLKQWEMAQLISVTPQYLTQLLKDMEQEGIIRRKKGWVIVSDPHKLVNAAEF